MLAHPEHDGHERVLHAHDPLTGLKTIVAPHHSGPSLLEVAAETPFTTG